MIPLSESQLILLKALTPDEKAAVKALCQYERDRAINEASKVVVLEKEPEIVKNESKAVDWKKVSEDRAKEIKFLKTSMKIIIPVSLIAGGYAGCKIGSR